MGTLGELLRAKMAKDAAEKSAIMAKALAIAFIGDILENNANELTETEQNHAMQVCIAACENMEKAKEQITAYDLFNQAVDFLEDSK